MKVISEINQIAVYEAWTPETGTKDAIEEAVKVLNYAFPELKAELMVKWDNFVEHGFDIKLRLKITGGKE